MIEELLAYIFSSNPISVPRLVPGITKVFDVNTPTNELVIGAFSWLVILGLWFFVNNTRLGKTILAAAINPRGISLLGFELSSIYRLVWGLYGLLAGVAGVLLATFIGASPNNIGGLTASAFIIVILGGLGSVPGSLLAAYIIGFIETLVAYLGNPAYRTLPALFMLVIVLYLRPQGFFGRR
jgi:branched-chain amino acid transport system permease protein